MTFPVVMVIVWFSYVGFLGFCVWMARTANARSDKRQDVHYLGRKGWD